MSRSLRMSEDELAAAQKRLGMVKIPAPKVRPLTAKEKREQEKNREANARLDSMPLAPAKYPVKRKITVDLEGAKIAKETIGAVIENDAAAAERKRFAQQGAAARWSKEAKPRKYRNKPMTVVDPKTGEPVTFDSTGEAERYLELYFMELAGEIEGLRRQVPFALTFNGEHIGNYVADFVYVAVSKGRCIGRVVEDWKSPASRTDLYRWKIKHLYAEHGIRVVETGKSFVSTR